MYANSRCRNIYDFLVYYVRGPIGRLYFSPDVYFIGDIFSRARAFPGRDSILRSRGWGQTRIGEVYITSIDISIRAEPNKHRLEAIFLKHLREFNSWPHSKLGKCPTRRGIFINLWNYRGKREEYSRY